MPTVTRSLHAMDAVDPKAADQMLPLSFRTAVFTRSRAWVAGLCLVAVCTMIPVSGWSGSAGTACVFASSPCLTSMSLATSASTGMGLAGFPGGTLPLVFTLAVKCPSCPTMACSSPATPTKAQVSLAFFPRGAEPCPTAQPVGVPVFSFDGPLAVPGCTSMGAFTDYNIVVPVPAATPMGSYCALGSVTVTFSDGKVLTAGSSTEVCIMPSVEGMPGVPRLELVLLSESAPRRAPGDVALALYEVRNHDPIHSVSLTAVAGSRQSALRPQGANERQGVFAISNPFGDDFPIQFNPGGNCIPLPEHPHTQPAINHVLPLIPPGGTRFLTVGIRSYGQSARGSCSESSLRVAGTFTDGSPALACAGMALIVDTSVPSMNCGNAVNDCNFNGIPDALDIADGRSQDRNFNARPDECEEILNVPFASSVTPTNPMPGQPIQVQVAFNESIPMNNVWANGTPLVRIQLFGLPVWEGTIPADVRPGPQTVYFLGKDILGGISTFIAPYDVPPPPRINRIYLDGNHDVILEHNGAELGRGLYIQEHADLTCPSCWTTRPGGPHASPHNAGPAAGTRFFRLHD